MVLLIGVKIAQSFPTKRYSLHGTIPLLLGVGWSKNWTILCSSLENCVVMARRMNAVLHEIKVITVTVFWHFLRNSRNLNCVSSVPLSHDFKSWYLQMCTIVVDTELCHKGGRTWLHVKFNMHNISICNHMYTCRQTQACIVASTCHTMWEL